MNRGAVGRATIPCVSIRRWNNVRGHKMDATLIRAAESEVEVCVPGLWTNRQIVEFADKNAPGPSSWQILTRDIDARSHCSALRGHIHIILFRGNRGAAR